jgi:tRNA threonylcarbamoyladenosine biosynthesis protein TsaB
MVDSASPPLGAEGADSRPVVLALDSAGSTCSVAVSVGDTVASTERITIALGQAERLLPMADRALSRAGLPPTAVDAVATTIGPGSFTGIRIGLAAAKGIALASGARLVGVSSFDAVAVASAHRHRFLLVALESRREDIYIQLFDPQHDSVCEPVAMMPAGLGDVVNAMIGSLPLLIAGDAAQRAAVMFSQRPDTTVFSDSAPDAIGALRAALRRLRIGERDNGARPLYLRPPDVMLPVERRKPDLGQR